MPVSEYGTFAEVRARLDEIVAEVRNRELPLEKSLDLYEEAIKLGNRCAELVDKPDFSEEEAEAAREALAGAALDVSISGQATGVSTAPNPASEAEQANEHDEADGIADDMDEAANGQG